VRGYFGLPILWIMVALGEGPCQKSGRWSRGLGGARGVKKRRQRVPKRRKMGTKCPGNERCEVKSLAVRCLFRFTLPDRASPVPRCFATIIPFPPWLRFSLHSTLSFILSPLSSAHWWRPADWAGIISHQDCCRHTAVRSWTLSGNMISKV
jgi:hypothetical protein